ncbi:MAG: NYN domain-containing protein [Candidatus Brocadiaceae bacterium]|nr:NYN domain-containing protein [Candidatus Brocadiaceae bacterium]
MLIIIDGYNFVFTVPALEKLVGINRIEPVREHVISLFSKYKQIKHYDITVVFDGNYTQAALPKKQMYSGVTVIYSRAGTSADTEIKNITSICQNPADVHIVTYDNEIKRHVRKCGCHVIEPKAMYREILEILTSKKNISDEPESKQKGPSESDAQYWKDIFKDVPDEELKSYLIKADMPKIKRKKTPPSHGNEPHCKYQGPSVDETQYWVRIFKEIGTNEHQD